MYNKFEVNEGIVTIFLNRGLETTINEEDFPKVEISGTWTCMPNGAGKPYVIHKSKSMGSSYLRLHRLIMECPDDMVVDHIDGDPLNNVRENLRILTQGENSQNRDYKVKTSTGIRGVTQTGPNSFRVRVGQRHIGSFKTLELASKAVDDARRGILEYDRG